MVTVTSIMNETEATTHMTNEAVVKKVTRNENIDIPRGLHKTADIGFDQSAIKDFLAKPYRIGAGAWDTSMSPNTVIWSNIVPQALVGDNLYGNKLKGFLGIRATVRVRVQVNGTKFQAGRLLCTFYPQGGMVGSFTTYRRRTLTSSTQLPRVELDVSSETEVIMDIPYIAPAPYYNLLGSNAEQQVPHGSFAIQVYSPLTTGSGSTSVEYTVWMSLHDVELVGAATQMSDRRPKQVRGDVSEKELAGYGGKPLSGGLLALSKIASDFSAIPSLSSVAKPASWVLQAMSGAASVFGYSKPTEQGAMTRVMTMDNVHMPNADGVDPFPHLSISSTNSLGIMPGFAGTDVDEMTISHIAQIPAYADTFAYSTGQDIGAVVAQFPVHPFTFSDTLTYDTYSCKDMTPVGYMATSFQMWRGSMTLTLKFVKTQYHSGRLLIVFTPKNTPGDIDDSSYALREIIDIRDSTEYRFSIPYMTLQQFYPIDTANFDATVGYTGYVTIYVLNKLVAPETVTQNVPIIAEWSGGPDIEFAEPSACNVVTFMPSGFSTQMDDRAPGDLGPSSRIDRNEDLSGMGNSAVPTPGLDPSRYCVGEKINSILQLLKRYSAITPTPSNISAADYVDVRPYCIGALKAPPSVDKVALVGDYYAKFAALYRYGRGCIRMMAINIPSGSSAPINQLGIVQSYPRTGSSDVLFTGAGYYPVLGSAVAIQPGKTFMGATIPAYQRQHCRLHRFSVPDVMNEPVDANTTDIAVRFNKTTTGSGDYSSLLYRAAADDLTFGYFVGCPLLILY